MDIHLQCDKCQQPLVIDEAGAGLEIQCPKCGQVLLVPTSTADVNTKSQTIRTSPQGSNQFASGERPPPWAHVPYPILTEATSEQRKFYDYWLGQFERGNIVPLGLSNWGYFFAYLFTQIAEFLRDKDIRQLEQCVAKIQQGYLQDSHGWHNTLTLWLSDAYLYLRDYEKAWALRVSIERGVTENFDQRLIDILKVRSKCADTSIDGLLLLHWTRFGLTKYGIAHRREVAETLTAHLGEFHEIHGHNFLEHTCGQFDLSRPEEINAEELIAYGQFKDMEDYRQWRDMFDQFNQGPWKGCQLQIFYGLPVNAPDVDNEPIPLHVTCALKEDVKRLIRQCENELRRSRNLPDVGEGWIAEAELFQKLSESFPNEKIVRHARPNWLAPQHLDVFLPVRNIGIEYQGEQHQRPIEFFGGQRGHEEVQERDERKRMLCEQHGCRLIYVTEGYSFVNVKARVEALISSANDAAPGTM